jgi:8-oxo-dGTP pyrophosphatase MutT (NUDIX family)
MSMEHAMPRLLELSSRPSGPDIPPDFAARLDPIDAPLPDPGRLRHAAVLAILLPERATAQREGTRLVLIERSGSLRSHAGQLAFPGGKPEPGDPSLLDTALREAEEEVVLARRDAGVLGRLSAVPTPTGFMIVPYVAWAPQGWQPTLGASPEVHRILTPTLSLLGDPAVHRITGGGVWDGYRYELHEFAIHEPPLWGATARMVWDLLERLRGAESPE